MHAYERKRGRRGGRARINGRKARWVKNEKADRIAKDVDKIAKCFLSLQADFCVIFYALFRYVEGNGNADWLVN